jgi:hypothetical protein
VTGTKVGRAAHTIGSWAPSRTQGVQVRAAHATMCDLDVDVVLGPLLRFKFSPNHLSIDSVRRLAQPPFEFVCSHVVENSAGK